MTSVSPITLFLKYPKNQECGPEINLMKRTKLIRVFNSFNASELRRLKDFIISPFFNKNEKIQSLFEFIIQYAPDFENKNLTEEKAFNYVFKNEEYKSQAITKLSSKLYKLIQNFIHIELGADSSVHADISFLSFLGERELVNEFTQHLNQVKKDIDNATMRDANYFYEQFLVEQELSKLHSFRTDIGTTDVNYQPAVNALDKYYLVQKLIYLCHQYNRQLTSERQQYSFELMKELETYIPKSPYFEIPTIKIWFTTLQLLKSDNKIKYYFGLRKLVFHHYRELNIFDIRNVLSTIQNNARMVFEKKEDYYSELFDLYNFQLERGIFNHPVIFTSQIFLNIITTAILLDKLVWTAQFLKDHENYSSNREDNVHALGKAMLAFAEGNYSDAHSFLNECTLKNIYFKLSEKRLRLKVYFELPLFDLVDDMINSSRKFFSKNKESISAMHLQANRDFINITKHIFYLQKHNDEKIQIIEKEINETVILPERKWLQKKITELRK